MRTRTSITQLELEDPRNKVGIPGAAIEPENVAALRHVLLGLRGREDYEPTIRALLEAVGVDEELEIDRWIEAATKGLEAFVSLTSPNLGRLPFVLVAGLTDERTMDDRIRRSGEESGR